MALWLKISASIATNPKIMAAGPAAAWLWLAGVGHCRINESDGYIPRMVVPGLVPGLKAPFKHAATLTTVGLWHCERDGYRVNDYLDWNPSREELESGRLKDRARKRVELQVETTEASGRNPDGIQMEPSRVSRGRANSTLTLGIPGSEVSGEESARETQRSIGWNEAYHRRNCPPWAIRSACRGGFCIPKYLWPKWELRFGGPSTAVSVELREFTDGVMAKTPPGAGDREEEFWPRHFEAKYGTTAPVAQKAGKGARTAHAFDLAAEMLAAQDAARRDS